MELPNLHAPLYGHDKPKAQIAQAIAANCIPNAYLFSGQQGIGKATLAWHIAAYLLTRSTNPVDDTTMNLFGDALSPEPALASLEFDPNHPDISRMQQGSHDGFLWLRPAYDEKRKAFKAEITIDQSRSIKKFLSLTSDNAGWKIVLIDSADIMNANASNALLKWLEEPPPRTLFLLIAHGRGLLPTIISRCRRIAFAPLPKEDFSRILGADAATADTLYYLTTGSVGLAMIWQRTKWKDYWHNLLKIAASDTFPFKAAQQLSTQLAKDELFPIASVQRLFESLILSATRFGTLGIMDAPDNPEHLHACRAVSARHDKENLQHLWNTMLEVFHDTDALYLNKSQVIFNMLATLFIPKD